MITIGTFDKDVKVSGRHIIRLKENVALEGFIADRRIKTVYKFDGINAFAVGSDFDKNILNKLCTSEDVNSISEVPVIHLCVTVQNDAPWGLARFSRNQPPGDNDFQNYQYEYDGTPAEAGAGVNIYIIDAGVLHTHNEFRRPDGTSRAQPGPTFPAPPNPPPPNANADMNGHGTHCAGIAAGRRFGVAKGANIIGIKTGNGAEMGDFVDVIAALEHIRATAAGPSVVSMSFDGPSFQPLVDEITNVITAGIHVVVAAGHGQGRIVATVSPANAPTAITVGYTNINDEMVPGCNFGNGVNVGGVDIEGVNIFAPGFNIESSWIDEAGEPANGNTHFDSGTSLATAYIAGLVAYSIGRNGNVAPNVMRTNLVAAGRNVVIHDRPNTTHILAHH